MLMMQGYYVTCPFEGDPKTCVVLWPFMQMTQFKAFFLQLHNYIEQACRWLTEHSVMSIKSKKLDRNANVIQINMQMNENVKGKCAGEALFN